MGPKESHIMAVGLPLQMARTPLFPNLIVGVVLEGKATIELG